MKTAYAGAALLMLGGCSHALANGAPVARGEVAAAAADGPSLVRTILDDAEFQPLVPGVAAHFIYGGMGLGVPTAQIGRVDAGLTFPAHSHSGDYHAVVVQGRFQHWEVADADKGPIMTPGATFFQGRDVAHYDSCLGPEQCLVYVTFAERADVTIAQ